MLLKERKPGFVKCKRRFRSRTFNGECNNMIHRNWGAADTPFYRILPAQYFDADGLNDPIGYPDQPNAHDIPSPFKISRDFIKVEETSLLSLGKSHVVMQFGQFLDHDLDLTDDSEGNKQFCKRR